MSEETEMDLMNAISDDMANISEAMRSHTPLQLAEAARSARDTKVCSIRDQVLAGRAITGKQLWVLADYFVNHAECDFDEELPHGRAAMTKKDFKARWEGDLEGGGITYNDIAECAIAWGISSTPKIKPMPEITYKVLIAAGVKDAGDYKPDAEEDED